MVFTLLRQVVAVLAAAEAERAAKAAEATKAERAARRRPPTGKGAEAITGSTLVVRFGSVAVGSSDMGTPLILMATTLRATLPPLIPLHALIHLLFMLLIRLLLLLNLLAITVLYLHAPCLILHAVTMKFRAMHIHPMKNILNTVPATATILLPVTTIIVTAS